MENRVSNPLKSHKRKNNIFDHNLDFNSEYSLLTQKNISDRSEKGFVEKNIIAKISKENIKEKVKN